MASWHAERSKPITWEQHVRMLLVLGLLASAAVTLYTLREILG